MKTFVGILVGILLVFVGFAVKNQIYDGKKPVESRSDHAGRPAGSPEDYFPTAPGTSWTYSITIGEEEPTKYEEIIWPTGEAGHAFVTSTRGRFSPAMSGTEKEFTLQFRSKAKATKQGELEYPIGVELEIVKDELGVFENSKSVFFAATPSGGFMAHLVVVYDPSTPGNPTTGGAWGSWGGLDGYSRRIFMFVKEPMTQVSMNESKDKLLFTGLDVVPGMKEKSFHYIRAVDPQDERIGGDGPTNDRRGRDIISAGFTEDLWFARGKGLVMLVQRRNGKITMMWFLTDFSSPFSA